MKITNALAFAAFANCGSAMLIAHCFQDPPAGTTLNNCDNTLRQCSKQCFLDCQSDSEAGAMSKNGGDCDCWCNR
ncbi:hypothetical protein C8034_v006337 [Colletotrichum sidae]|uniref:Uncharacterized protein n=2 Tax=Colletotrichum orbiculare species complex TaxID=2707354 RepID=A0A4V6QEA7_9PEZI|nr:hypothetical protein C8035_v007557 [Colletotrichum spinosum]TEA22124.1 hypothetical protein C8034_v006337 [Colletotrichum sidae]